MAQLYYKVIAYLEANGKTKDDASKVELVNNADGKGDIIETWGVEGLSKPTDQQRTPTESNNKTNINQQSQQPKPTTTKVTTNANTTNTHKHMSKHFVS